MKKFNSKNMSASEKKELTEVLKARFEENPVRHRGIKWEEVQKKLEGAPDKLWSLGEMERTGGEPDVVGFDKKTREYIFIDCSSETPKGRRNVCYDHQGQEEREKKGIHPAGNAIDMAANMGVEVLTGEQYQALQKVGNFDTKTSSWLKTPSDIRELGGAIFADRRYGQVFIYHNSAPTFYQVRGFRGTLSV